MSLEHAILGLLSAGPQTGYDLKTRCFDAALSHAWTADQAQIYRTLDKLLARDLVADELIPQRGKPDRRVYTITPAGKDALTAWLAAPLDLPAPRDALLLKLQFAGALPPAEITSLLDDARAVHEARANVLRERLEAARSPRPDDPCPPLGGTRGRTLHRLALEGAIDAEERTIAWLGECISAVSPGRPSAKRGDGTKR